ncbi:DUF4157 domain-containing protein [Thalassomonas sp. RHCl1]|uniref:eCIS core domain-containing protein n=1 Tax=Thalassomonas sp. RHCl1 TaxID=2995320 RepID=UPI00248B34B3|nr:DUF4157 domain-containing protein [Thalassomonas sp. RHCl1]
MYAFKNRAANHSKTAESVNYQGAAAGWKNRRRLRDILAVEPAAVKTSAIKITRANDADEQQADRLADQVMSTTVADNYNRVQRQGQVLPAGESHHQALDLVGKIQRRAQSSTQMAAAAEPAPGVGTAVHGLNNRGMAMPESSRAFFEPRFGRDFSGVKFHHGGYAENLAEAVNARAFTFGNHIVFGRGEYQPQSDRGRHLISHELAHVLQQGGQSARIQRLANCTSGTDADDVIKDHTVSPAKIEKPGDEAEVTVAFNCKVREFQSDFIDSSGASLGKQKNYTRKKNAGSFEVMTRKWDGKIPFPKVGTYLADDGKYRHILKKVKYKYKNGTAHWMAENDKNIKSPQITLVARAYTGSGSHHPHFNATNKADLATIIRSELGVGNTTEQTAIAWAVRNQMIRLNTNSVEKAKKHFKDADDQSATTGTNTIAETVLKQNMTADTVSGAIKWYSPRSMPKKGEEAKCKPPKGTGKFSCGGGTIRVKDTAGTEHDVYAPKFHKHMTYVSVGREWYVRFYKL